MSRLILLLSAVLVIVTSSGPCGTDEPAQGSFPAGCSWESLSSDNTTLVQGCASKVTCVWKCCPQGQGLNTSNKCIPNNHTFRPSFGIDQFHILIGNPCLEQRFQLDEDDIIDIEDNGILVENLPDGSGKNNYPAGGYCLDDIQNEGTFFKTVALVCDPNEEEVEEPAEEGRGYVTFLIYTIGRIIALPFLIATVAVYAVIPELRNLHGKCLVSHVTSLSVAYVFLIVIAIAGRRELVTWVCVTTAFFAYFFMLGSFFWLNIMCFDIWWTFSGYRRVIGGKGSDDERRDFMVYSLYAWGAPVVMLCVTLIIEFAPSVPDSFIKPDFGVAKCWFKDKTTVLAYFSGPVAFLIFTNLVFFGVTAKNILRVRKQTSVLSSENSRRNDNHKHNEQRFVLYLKLFVVMGVTWILELIGWAIGGPDYYWWVFDLANILQGILIFIIFVWKSRVRKLLRQRFNIQSLSPSSSGTGTASTGDAVTPL